MKRMTRSDYDYKLFRVVRADGKVSTISMAWDDYTELLLAMPFKNIKGLARSVRAAVQEVDAEPTPAGQPLSKEVLRRLQVRYGVTTAQA